MTTIAHHGAWNRNSGDWVLHHSIQSHLQRRAGHGLRFVSIDSQRTVYDTEQIEAVNDECDLLLLGGGGLIFHRPEDASVSGWQFNVRREDLARIRVPIVVYGVGWNRFPYDPDPFPPGFAPHLRAVQEQARLFSVRNAGTRSELVRRGLVPWQIRVVPDAGVFAPWRAPDLDRALPDDAPVLGWNVAGDRPGHRYPAPGEENESRCIETVARGVRRFCDRTGARLLLIPHLVGIDERYDARIRDIVGDDRVISLREAVPHMYPPRAETAPLIVGAYQRCDLVIGMRGHACLLPFGRGRRFVSFGSHCKTEFLMRDIGYCGARLQPEAMLAGRQRPEEVEAVLAQAWCDPGYGRLLTLARERQRSVFDQLNQDVIRLLDTARAARGRRAHDAADLRHRRDWHQPQR